MKMADYIINPSVFYWADILNLLKEATKYFSIFGWLVSIGCIIAYIYNACEADEYERHVSEMERYLKYAKNCKIASISLAIASTIFTIATIFIPNKETVMYMVVARTITMENVNWTVQQIKEIVDYIIHAVKGIV